MEKEDSVPAPADGTDDNSELLKSAHGFYGNTQLTVGTALFFCSSCEWKHFLFDSQ